MVKYDEWFYGDPLLVTPLLRNNKDKGLVIIEFDLNEDLWPAFILEHPDEFFESGAVNLNRPKMPA